MFFILVQCRARSQEWCHPFLVYVLAQQSRLVQSQPELLKAIFLLLDKDKCLLATRFLGQQQDS